MRICYNVSFEPNCGMTPGSKAELHREPHLMNQRAARVPAEPLPLLVSPADPADERRREDGKERDREG
ncbi:hypothetical protein E2C01_100037 [Portunus trituberculatus]|uniref:Uncharacterized protein n=1 Tax=Portunus trituberculatus TaxID=210409 RepID=A0A5B7KBY2_PORTR|nr:hypothetical protein [Portunus trituberculatus]